MTTIRHDVRARCDVEHVWALLADLTAVQSYNPTVLSAAFVGAQRTGVGAARSCALRPKGRLVERVTHWEEERALGLEVAESPWPIRFMRWVTRLEPNGGGTTITQDLEYEPKYGPLGRLLDAVFLRPAITRNVGAVLDELVRHAEQGARG